MCAAGDVKTVAPHIIVLDVSGSQASIIPAEKIDI